MLIIAMAGLPGTGKSTLARELSRELEALVIDKDAVRASLFGVKVDYSREQDDVVCQAIYAAVELLARSQRCDFVILDGRTYSRRYQVDELRALAVRCNAQLQIIECECAPETARKRLEDDASTGSHVAAHRTFELYLSLARTADEIEGEKLVIQTDGTSLDAMVARCLDALR